MFSRSLNRRTTASHLRRPARVSQQGVTTQNTLLTETLIQDSCCRIDPHISLALLPRSDPLWTLWPKMARWSIHSYVKVFAD